jgi:hypothetical protein
MLHILFVIAVVIIAIALLPAALAVLPWLLAGVLVVIGIGVSVASFAYSPEVAVALVVTAGVAASLYNLGQNLRRRAWQRNTGKAAIQPSESVGKALQQLHEALRGQLSDLERKLQLSRDRIQPGVEQRKELAKSLSIGERLLLIVGDIKYFPSWSERDPAWVCDLVSNIVVTEKSIHDYTVEFEFNNRRYAIEYEKHWFVGPDGDDSGPYFGHITLRSREGVELFTGRFSEGEYGGRVEFYDVEALRPGDWLGELLELAERIDALDRERELRHELGEVKRQRDRFGLDLEVANFDGDGLTGGRLRGEAEARSLVARVGTTIARCVRLLRLPRQSSS